MLYQFRESLQLAWSPFVRAINDSGEAQRCALDGKEPNELDRFSRASYELFERVTRRYEKPQFGLVSTIVEGEPIAVTEELVAERVFGRLIHFRREVDDVVPRVLLLPPMAGHFATLVRGTIESLLPNHDVYVADWTDARDIANIEGQFDLDDYVGYVLDFIRMLGPGTHVMGVCQATVPALIATSLLAQDDDPAQPRSLTLMAGPIDTRISPTAVNDFAEEHTMEWFEQVMVQQVPSNCEGAGRLVYPGFIQLGAFMGMNAERHAIASLEFFRNIVSGDEPAAEAHRLFYDEYLAVMDLTAEFYLQTVQKVFKEQHLARGMYETRGRLVDPGAIKHTALMTVEGERDDICGIGQTEAAHALVTNIPEEMRGRHLQEGVGHFGVFSGRRWRGEIMPKVRDFIRTHDRRD